MMSSCKGKRIRRRSSTTISRTRDNDNRRLQLKLIGGVLYLAVTSTTRTISINAFPLSSPFVPPTYTIGPWLQSRPSNLDEQSCDRFYNSNPQRQRHQLQHNSHRLLHGTFLAAKAGKGTAKSSITAATIDSKIDASSIASMDPEYQKYKESLQVESGNEKMTDTNGKKSDEDGASLYKDFGNFYSQNGHDSGIENGEDESLYKDFENFYKPPNDNSGSESKTSKKASSRSDPESNSDMVEEKNGTIDLDAPEPTTEKAEEQEQHDQPVVRPAVSDTPVHMQPLDGFNVVLTHCTADFDSLASAVGLAKLWTSNTPSNEGDGNSDFDSSRSGYPTFVVLPRGAHPAVQRFLALHKHLFPIRSLKSLPDDLSKLHRLALVDAQRMDRIGPADVLIPHADRITVVDHHVDMESDIPGVTDYVVDGVGSVSTLIVERLMKQQDKQLENQLETSSSPITTLTEAEATLLALGIHADTGSLCFDSSTPRDASALAWVMHQGASQVAIAEHAQSSLSREQQAVLTQAIVNANSTVAHGVTVSTVLLTADGFINGLAAVTQDAMELSSADVFLLGVVYEPKSGRGGKGKKQREPGVHVMSKLLAAGDKKDEPDKPQQTSFPGKVLSPSVMYKSELARIAEEKRIAQELLRASFDKKDLDGNGFIDRREMSKALVASGIVATEDTVVGLMESIDTNQDGLVDFDEFVAFANNVKAVSNNNNRNKESEQQRQDRSLPPSKDKTKKSSNNKNGNADSSSTSNNSSSNNSNNSSTLIIIGRAKPGVNMKSVKLGKLLEKYGGGGHPKAASATVRLNDESEAASIMSDLVEELIETSLREQSTVGDFMTSPVLSVSADMSEKQVEDLFNRYDVRALPVVNGDHEVIGLVTYKEVSAAKQRMFNKEQKYLRQEQQRKEKEAREREKNPEKFTPEAVERASEQRKFIEEQRLRKKPTVKAWMKQHIKTVEASLTMAEAESILLENDVGCIPVVMDGTKMLVGMVTRTDLLRQHRYYPSLHYNNKGMSDSLASRKHIVALRKKLKQFDLDE